MTVSAKTHIVPTSIHVHFKYKCNFKNIGKIMHSIEEKIHAQVLIESPLEANLKSLGTIDTFIYLLMGINI